MDAETFPDKRVQDLINRHYIPVRIEADKNQGLMEEYGVSGLPTILILDKDGKVLETMVGFRDANDLSATLEEVAEKR